MRKWKYALVFGLASFLLMVSAIIACMYWPEKPSEITPENARRIQPGMSLQEVEIILGGPARFDYDGRVEGTGSSHEVDRAAMRRLNQPKPPSSVRELRWGSGTVTVDVHFDTTGKCLPVRYMLHRPVRETLLEWIAASGTRISECGIAAKPPVSLRPGPHFSFAQHNAVAAVPGELTFAFGHRRRTGWGWHDKRRIEQSEGFAVRYDH